MSADSLGYLLRRVGLVEDRIRAMVAHRRADDPAPDDPFRGLYLTDEVVDALLAPAKEPPRPDRQAREAVERLGDRAESTGSVLRLRRLATESRLTELDVELLVIALVPDLDSRFERLYGYLNDDVTRRRATVGLALALADVSPASAAARSRLLPGGPLIEQALVQVEDADRPYLTRALRVPDRVTAHLLGDDALDPVLVGTLADPVAHPELFGTPLAARMAAAVAAGQRLVYVRGPGIGVGVPMAVTALTGAGMTVLSADLTRLAGSRDPLDVVSVLGREALLRGAAVVAGPVEALADVSTDALRRLADLLVPVVLVGAVTWDPTWTEGVPLVVDAPTLTPTDRATVWTRELAGLAGTLATAGADNANGTVPIEGMPIEGGRSRACRSTARRPVRP